jgi:hypothetical protein
MELPQPGTTFHHGNDRILASRLWVGVVGRRHGDEKDAHLNATNRRHCSLTHLNLRKSEKVYALVLRDFAARQ